MEHSEKTGLIILFSIPFLLIMLYLLYEGFGMCMNHNATKRQTERLQTNLETEIPDITIVNIYSETGNTSGTGNHVDCLSSVTFSTKMQISEIENRMSKYYELDNWGCYVKKTEDGNYLFYINTSAPFPDNLEGH